MDAYRTLESRFRRLAAIEGATSMLHWDQSTMMPAGGAQVRAEQLAELKVIRHELLTDPKINGLLGAAENEKLDAWQRANLREMRRRWRNATGAGSQAGGGVVAGHIGRGNGMARRSAPVRFRSGGAGPETHRGLGAGDWRCPWRRP
jgi:hypothetical protein